MIRDARAWTSLNGLGRGLTLLAAIGAASGQAVRPASASGGPDCFTKADSRSLPYRVFQTASVPANAGVGGSESGTSPYWPGTDFVTRTNRVVGVDARYHTWYFTWVNRCQSIVGETRGDDQCTVRRRLNGAAIQTVKGNSYEGGDKERAIQDQVRAAFSSYAAADSCTIAQEMQALGLPDTAIDARARAGGVRVYRGADRSGAVMRPLTRMVGLADGSQWSYLVNLCVLPAKGGARAYSGFGLDYEVNDNRTTADTNALLGEYARLAHAAGKGVFIAINPLPRAASGIDGGNVQQVLQSVDYLSVALSNGATAGNPLALIRSSNATGSLMQSYRAQLAVFGAGGATALPPRLRQRLVWQVPLYQIGLDDAAALQAAIRRDGFAGVSLTRNFVKQGGSCARDVNQITACVALGQCDGRFGTNRL